MFLKKELYKHEKVRLVKVNSHRNGVLNRGYIELAMTESQSRKGNKRQVS